MYLLSTGKSLDTVSIAGHAVCGCGWISYNASFGSLYFPPTWRVLKRSVFGCHISFIQVVVMEAHEGKQYQLLQNEQVLERNVYSLQFFDNWTDLLEHSCLNNWLDCTMDKFKAFIGFQMMMNVWSKLQIADYWVLREYWQDTQASRISCHVTVSSSFLEKSKQSQEVKDGYYSLFKSVYLIGIVKHLHRQHYVPQKELGIYELYKFKRHILANTSQGLDDNVIMRLKIFF